MTAPRMLLPGASYLLTRRCVDRKFLLRPGRAANRVIGYLLALCAGRSRIQVHAYCVMSNHLHLVVTDAGAELPRFLQDLDSLLARALNALYGRRGYFWDEAGCNATLLDSPEDVLDRCAYALANPVTAGLVRSAARWPGLLSMPDQLEREVVFERPAHFFRRDGGMPLRASLKVVAPSGFESAAAFKVRLEAALAERERQAALVRGTFVGAARVLRQSIHDAPRTEERWRKLKPKFAARQVSRRMEWARRFKAFFAEYRDALLAWCSGDRGAVFPVGTYQMRVLHGAVTASAG